MPLDATTLLQDEYYAAKRAGAEFMKNMSQNSVDVYRQACAMARTRHAQVGEKAVGEAVRFMSEQGVHAYTYTRKDGTVVRVPADVGIRRVVTNSGKRVRNAQVLEIVSEAGKDLIQVTMTPNCRKTHEEINGKVFSISGTDPKYPAWSKVSYHLDEPNCGHELTAYARGFETVQDPLEDSGVSLAEARALISIQRRLENSIRKAKRTEQSLKVAQEAGADVTEELTATRRKMNYRRAQLRRLISENRVLVRQRHRERLHDKARRRYLRIGKNSNNNDRSEIFGPPANKHERAAILNKAKRHGAFIIEGREADAIIKSHGGQVEAILLNDVIVIRDDATISAILEEAYHFEQYLSNMFSEYTGMEKSLRREIDAQEHLLSLSGRYKMSSIEIDNTMRNLEMYRKMLEDLLNEGY